MKTEREHTSSVRNQEAVNELINAAIIEVIDAFGSEMPDRDRTVLKAVTEERSTDPVGRVIHLLQYHNAVGVSDKLKDYTNQILQTIRQNLTDEERSKFQKWAEGESILDDIV